MTTTTQDNTTVRIPRSLIERLRIVAQAHERSLSAELRVALDAYIRETLPDAKRELKRRSR